jgi:hypothetical protein
MNKFVEMWDYTNILHDHRNKEDKKLAAMQQMIFLLDAQTRDHFRAALAQVLRDERNPSVRHEAIKQLGLYFKWGELDMTWWLHTKRCPQDTKLLNTYEDYAKRKKDNGLDAKLLYTIVKELAA